jgi:hypothetical protein
LKDSRTKVSSASTIPLKPRGLSLAGARRNRCRQRNGVVGWTPQSAAVLARLLPSIIARAMIEPFLLLAQMRHRRLGQRIEGAPATLAAKPQKHMRAAPTDDLAARAIRTALSRDALDAGRSQRVLLAAALAAPLCRTSSLGPDRARLLKRRDRLRAMPLVHSQNRLQPSGKIPSLHRIAPSIRSTLNKPTPNAIRAKNFRRFRPRNPLKNLDSDERIQGNPREFNPHERRSSQRNGRAPRKPKPKRKGAAARHTYLIVVNIPASRW